jgi:hypothetical protein
MSTDVAASRDGGWRKVAVVVGGFLVLAARAGGAPAASTLESRLEGPAGSHVGPFAEGVKNARFLRFTPAGDLRVDLAAFLLASHP